MSLFCFCFSISFLVTCRSQGVDLIFQYFAILKIINLIIPALLDLSLAEVRLCYSEMFQSSTAFSNAIAS